MESWPNVTIGSSATFPKTKQGKPPSNWPDDAGLKGSDGRRPSLGNKHPHQAHSAGYLPEDGTSYDNHGIAAVHIVHGRDGQGGEHHGMGL